MSLQVGIGSLDGTVFFQVGLCNPQRTMFSWLHIGFYYSNYENKVVFSLTFGSQILLNSTGWVYCVPNTSRPNVKQKSFNFNIQVLVLRQEILILLVIEGFPFFIRSCKTLYIVITLENSIFEEEQFPVKSRML